MEKTYHPATVGAAAQLHHPCPVSGRDTRHSTQAWTKPMLLFHFAPVGHSRPRNNVTTCGWNSLVTPLIPKPHWGPLSESICRLLSLKGIPIAMTGSPKRSVVRLSSTSNPSSVGQAVTFTATVSPSSATGTVTFFDGSATLGSGTLNNGTATLTTSGLSAGNHSIVATYNGDNTFWRFFCDMVSDSEKPAPRPRSLQVRTLPFLGQSLIFTATVSPSGATGTVTFFDGSATLGSGTLE